MFLRRATPYVPAGAGLQPPTRRGGAPGVAPSPRRVAWCAAVALLLACHRAAAPLPGPPLEVGGWAPYWDLPAALASLPGPALRPSDVFLFAGQLAPGGEPVLARPRDDYRGAVEAVRRSGASAWLTIVNDVVDAAGRATLKDPAVVHDVLADAPRRARHREQIIRLARELGVSGVDLDYENLQGVDRDRFSAFVADLAVDARAAGLRVSVTVQPKSADTAGDRAGAADWAALCRSVDRLQIMLYNEHGAGTGPGPLATPAWMDRILSFAEGQCPREKVVAAIKVVGMEWSPGGTRDLTFSAATALGRAEGARVRRAAGEVPWFSYGPRGERTVYYEDARSLRLKLLTAARHGAGAVMLWSLGQEDPAVWAVVEELQKRPSSRKVAFTD